VSTKVLGSLGRISSELRLMGFKGTIRRAIFEFRRRSGIELLSKIQRPLDIEAYLKDITRTTKEAVGYKEYWFSQRTQFGIANSELARTILASVIPKHLQQKLSATARDLGKGSLIQFGHNKVNFGDLIWNKDPESNVLWPNIHSSKLLLQASQYGDIKLVWEIGRFSWAMDLVRAWLCDGNEKHLNLLFELIEDFALKNPLYTGPHWSSEQEVAIRALMLIFVQEVLADVPALSDKRLQLLHALLVQHGRYLERDLDYAEFAIRNNHLIHGALGLYAIGHALPWYPKAQKWCSRGLFVLTEAIDEQWYEDGGYVQPSHNYQRSAWHGMLWARSIAKHRGDTILLAKIIARAQASLNYFLAQVDPASGQLANWGANDGALIGTWTECDFSDFRPLIQSLAALAQKRLPFPQGPWDEELFWFLGEESLANSRSKPEWKTEYSFKQQGLHVIRPDANNFAILRCGSMRSRYGQQADQLHVDLWRNNNNLALDPGSFNYNKNLEIHNWFRGTRGHNTIILDEQDQMIPHRTFKYLRWTKAKAEIIKIEQIEYAIIGVHHGYTRLKGKWCHARALMYWESSWIVVDRIWSLQKHVAPISMRLHWQLHPAEIVTSDGSIEIRTKSTKDYLTIVCSNPEFQTTTKSGDFVDFDGWNSRYYNFKEPVPAINATLTTAHECYFASIFSVNNLNAEFIEGGSKLVIEDGIELSLDILKCRSDALILELLNL